MTQLRWTVLLLSLACERERESAYAEPERCIEADCGPIRVLDASAAPLDDAGYLRGDVR